jgi:hypothetical protein
MGRPRLYADEAERQRAYRERQAERLRQLEEGIVPLPKPSPSRPQPRPVRLQRAILELAALASEYEDKRESVPDHLTGGAYAEKLDATIDMLHEVLDTLAGADLPKGFGRD